MSSETTINISVIMLVLFRVRFNMLAKMRIVHKRMLGLAEPNRAVMEAGPSKGYTEFVYS
jgi:hypothetical protein